MGEQDDSGTADGSAIPKDPIQIDSNVQSAGVIAGDDCVVEGGSSNDGVCIRTLNMEALEREREERLHGSKANAIDSGSRNLSSRPSTKRSSRRSVASSRMQSRAQSTVPPSDKLDAFSAELMHLDIRKLTKSADLISTLNRLSATAQHSAEREDIQGPSTSRPERRQSDRSKGHSANKQKSALLQSSDRKAPPGSAFATRMTAADLSSHKVHKPPRKRTEKDREKDREKEKEKEKDRAVVWKGPLPLSWQVRPSPSQPSTAAHLDVQPPRIHARVPSASAAMLHRRGKKTTSTNTISMPGGGGGGGEVTGKSGRVTSMMADGKSATGRTTNRTEQSCTAFLRAASLLEEQVALSPLPAALLPPTGAVHAHLPTGSGLSPPAAMGPIPLNNEQCSTPEMTVPTVVPGRLQGGYFYSTPSFHSHHDNYGDPQQHPKAAPLPRPLRRLRRQHSKEKQALQNSWRNATDVPYASSSTSSVGMRRSLPMQADPLKQSVEFSPFWGRQHEWSALIERQQMEEARLLESLQVEQAEAEADDWE
jgi:hypothetical protein